MFRILGILLLYVWLTPALPAQTSAAPPPEMLTLEEAIATALQNNRPLHISALEVDKLDEKLSAMRTLRLPAFAVSATGFINLTPLSFEFKQGVFGTYPNPVGQVPAQDTEITTPRRLNGYFLNTVAQPLSQQYKIGLNLRKQQLARDIGREELRGKQHAIRNQVTRAYYEIAQTQTALEANTQAVEFYRELDRVTDQWVLQQVVLKGESLEVKLRLARERLETVKLRNELDTYQERMNQLLGRDLRLRFRVETSGAPSLTELDLGIAQAHALERRPEIRQAQLKKKQAEYDRRHKKAEYIPDISLLFQQLSFPNVEMLPKNSMTAGLNLVWEPFDWGRKRHELAEKTKVIEQTDAALRETEAEVLVDVNTQFRRVQETAASLLVAQLAADTAKEKLRVANDAYRVQAVRLDRVLEAQSGVSNAASQYQRALSSYWTAKADLAKATGED